MSPLAISPGQNSTGEYEFQPPSGGRFWQADNSVRPFAESGT
jgi:hypothetical protein